MAHLMATSLVGIDVARIVELVEIGAMTVVAVVLELAEPGHVGLAVAGVVELLQLVANSHPSLVPYHSLVHPLASLGRRRWLERMVSPCWERMVAAAVVASVACTFVA